MRCIGFGHWVAIAGFVALAGCSAYSHSFQITPPTSTNGGKAHTRADVRSEPSLWASLRSANQILGLSRNGRGTVAAIDTAANGCYAPTGIKVDHKRALWVACNYDYAGSDCYYGVCSGKIQTYALRSSAPTKTYSDFVVLTCKNRSDQCWDMASPNDVAFDTHGNVFAANLATFQCVHHAHSGGGCFHASSYTWWLKAHPEIVHIEISSPSPYYVHLYYYLDVDAAGHLYMDEAEWNGSSIGPYQVYEVTDPTGASWQMTAITPPTSDKLGGIYVSNASTVLNVVDETARTISQYALPWVVSETPFNVLGPTLSQMGKGQPTSGGFDRREKHLALGDAGGWIDLGNVSSNKWTAAGKKALGSGVSGAAYVPSDK